MIDAQYPPEVQKFLNLKHRLFRGTHPAGLEQKSGESDKDFSARLRFESIQIMRREMIDNWRDGKYIAGVFIAGMDGVLDEFDRFRKHHPNAALFPIAATGGAVEMGWPPLDGPKDLAREFDRRPLMEQFPDNPSPTTRDAQQRLIALPITRRRYLSDAFSTPAKASEGIMQSGKRRTEYYQKTTFGGQNGQKFKNLW